MKIAIDCGHTISGSDYGAVGYLTESIETRNVGRELISLLKNAGHTVTDCTVDRADSVSSSLNQRCAKANAAGVDLFVSIHFNAGGGKGTEVFTYGGTRLTQAVRVCEKMAQAGFVNRGVKDGSQLAVINGTNANAMLVECCFVDTKSDEQLYKKIGHKAVATAIFEGITGESAKPAELRKETKTFKFVNVNVLGKNCEFTGFFENNENWVKARDALEAAGYTVGWNNEKKRVTAKKDGKETLLDIRTYISASGIAFCPIREMYEYLGFDVEWDSADKKISIR